MPPDLVRCLRPVAPRDGVEPSSLVLIQSQAGPAGRPTGDRRPTIEPRRRRPGAHPTCDDTGSARHRADAPPDPVESARHRADSAGLGSTGGPARDATRAPDARQGRERRARPGQARRAELRAEVGRLPLPGLQGRRRGRADQPQHQAADPLLPRARRGHARSSCRSGACSTARSSSRSATTPASTGCEFEVLQERIHPAASRDRDAGREDAGELRGLRPARAGRHVVRRPAVRRAPRRAGRGAGRPRRPGRAVPPDPHHRRPGGGGGVVPPVRGSRARRRDRQAAGGAVRRERPHHDEDQARAHRRRRGGRLPRAQDQHAGAAAARQPAAGPLPRRRAPARRA